MQTFFIPAQPEAFFEDNPWLAQRYRAPAQADAGLRFGPGCQSCAAPTRQTAALRGGLRHQGRPVAWEQTVHLCETCQRATARRQQQQRALYATTALLALLLGVLASLWARAASWQTPWVLLSFLLGASSWFGLLLAARRWLLPPLPPGSHGLSLDYFLDPRLGEQAWIICLRLEHPAQAEHFGRLNPHAISAQDWEANYQHLPTGEGRPGALP